MEVFVTVSEWPASGVILREGKVEKREKPQYSNDQDTPVTPSSAGGATEPPPTAVTTRPSPPAATVSRLRKYLLSKINYDQQLGPVPPSAGRRQSSPEPPARKTFGEDKVIWSPSHITIKHRTRPDQPPRSIVFPLCAFTHSRDLCSRTIDSRHQQHFSRLTTPTNTHRSRSSSQRPTFPQATRIPTSMGPNPDVAVQQILESRLTVASSQRTPRDTHITPRQHQFSRVCFGSRCSGGESGCALRLRSCDKLSYIFSLMSCSQTEVLAVEIIQKESISELVLKKFSQVRYHQLKPPRKNVYNLPLRIKVQISDLQSDTRDRQNYNLMLHVRREVVGFSQLVIKKQVSSVPPAVTGGQVSHIPPDNFKTQMTLIYSAETQNREFFLQKTELDVSYKLPARSNILNTRDGHTEDSGTPGSYNTHSSATTHHTSRGIRKSHWNPRQLPLFPTPRTPPARRPEPNHYEENRFKRSEVSSLDRDTTERFLLCGRSCHRSTVCNSGRESSAKRSEEEQQSREYGRLPRREIQLVALAEKSAREVTIMKDNWRIGAGPGIDLVKINTRKMETCDQRLCVNHQLATREKTSMVVNGCQQGTQEVEEDSQCEVTRWCRASPCHPGAIGRPALDRRQHGVVRQSGWVVWASWVLVMVAVWACVALTYAHPHQNTGGGCDDYITSPPNKSCYSLSLRNYPQSLAKLCPCVRVLGHLSITLMKDEGDDNQVLRNFTFPYLREITDYLLLYHVKGLTSLASLFPGLSVIRGITLFHNYALVVYSLSHLEDVGLHSLTTILRGSVRIERNPSLCYAHTVDWDNITRYRLRENVIKRNRLKGECASCPGKCRESSNCEDTRCWGPDHCQLLCPRECEGGCVGGVCCHEMCVGGVCCHEMCVGGCSSPHNASACVACRHVAQAGVCIRACPASAYQVGEECVEQEECKARGLLLMVSTGECVKTCTSPNHHKKGAYCYPVRECSDIAYVRSIGEAQLLQHCTSVDVLIISLPGGENVERELKQHLANIQEIRGYLKILRTNITSVSILPNLKRIRGEELEYNRSLVVVENPNLYNLTSWVLHGHNFTIDQGDVFFQGNPRLCLRQINTFLSGVNLTQESQLYASKSNGRDPECDLTLLEVKVRASPVYGTLMLTIEVLPANLLPSVDAYYVNYRKAPTNVTLQQDPCSASQGWSVVEVQREVAGGRRLEVEVGGLTPNTRYALYVKTHSPLLAANGTRSSLVYATTSSFNPSEAVGVRWASSSDSTLDVWWEPPRYPHGVVDHYLVTALMLPSPRTLPGHLNLCSSLSVQGSLGRISEEIKSRRTSSLEAKMRWEEEEGSGQEKRGEKKEGEEVCGATSDHTCCTCDHQQEEDDDHTQHNTQADFEEHILKGVGIENIHEEGGRPYPGWETRGSVLSSTQHSPVHTTSAENLHGAPYTLQDPPRLILPPNTYITDDQLISYGGVFRGSLTGGEGLQLQVPVGHGFFSNNSVRVVGVSEGGRTQTVARYQLHDPRLLHDAASPYTNGTLVMVQRGTREPRITLHHLRHFSTYLVGVVACLPPTTCTSTPTPTPTNTPTAEVVVQCKLCSSVAAFTAATTSVSTSADVVPTGSLLAVPYNTSSSVTFSWRPPHSPNGVVVSYHLQYTTGERQKTKCISQREYEAGGRQTVVRDLPPGNYTSSVRVRTTAGYGSYCPPVLFFLPDRKLPKEGGVVWWVTVLVVVVVVVVVVVSSVVVWWWRRSHTIPNYLKYYDDNRFYKEGFGPSEIFREEFILWRDNLKVLRDEPLGHGYFGMVFVGELKTGGGNRSSSSRRVAVKTHHDTYSVEDISQFLKEASNMQNIDCHHVVRLLGVVGDYSPAYVVMELMQNGDLKTFLRKHNRSFLSDQKVLQMAVEAADGMAYLAGQQLVHRDLAARNCLLDHNLSLKIGDFGLSRNLYNSSYYNREGSGALPMRWMAPESLQFSLYSTQSDVWSYGVLLWEMATRGDRPYGNNTNDEVCQLVVEQRATPSLPRHCPTQLATLMRRAWKFDPDQRPSFIDITSFLLQHVTDDFKTSFKQVSFYHNRAVHSISREAVGQEDNTQYLTSCSDEDDLQLFSQLTNTSDLSNDSTPEREESDWCQLQRQEESLNSWHPCPLYLPASSSANTHTLAMFNTEPPGESKTFCTRPSHRRLPRDPLVPNTEPEGFTIVCPGPHKPTDEEENSVTFPPILQSVASHSSPSVGAPSYPSLTPRISGDALENSSMGPSSVSSLQVTTPKAYPCASVFPASASLPRPQRNTSVSSVKPVSAPATHPGVPVHASPPLFSPSERLSNSQESLFSSLGQSVNQLSASGTSSSPDMNVLTYTELCLYSAASAPLLPCTTLSEASTITTPSEPFLNTHLPSTTPSPTSARVAAASAASPSLSCPSTISVFSATSDLDSGRRRRSSRHRHSSLRSVADTELL